MNGTDEEVQEDQQDQDQVPVTAPMAAPVSPPAALQAPVIPPQTAGRAYFGTLEGYTGPTSTGWGPNAIANARYQASLPQNTVGQAMTQAALAGNPNLAIEQQQKAVQAAMKYQAQRGYNKDIQGGMPVSDAMAKWGPMLFGGTGAGLSGVSSYIRATRPTPQWGFVPGAGGAPSTFQARGQRPIVVPQSRGPSMSPEDKAQDQFLQARVAERGREAASLGRAASDTKNRTPQEREQASKDSAEAARDAQRLLDKRVQLLRKYSTAPAPTATGTAPPAAAPAAMPRVTAPTTQSAPMPLPKDKKQLVEGQVYQTKRGPGRWNGTAFEPI